MYLRAIYADHSLPTLRQFIRDNPLGILITALPSPNFPTINISHIPWVLDVFDSSSETDCGKLRGHLARANPHSKAMIEKAGDDPHGSMDTEVSVLFNGPAHSYVTPKFYKETKPATGKVVPTWNYSAVQAYGRARILFDTKAPETGEFLQKQVEDLTVQSEADMGYGGKGQQKAWEVADAPKGYTEVLKKAIIGIEIDVERLEGKFKFSQERPEGDRQGVVNGFRALGTDEGEVLAKTTRERADMFDAEKERAKSTK